MGNGDFAARLALILKALSLSRGRLAADLGVDKSLVGRWCSGAVTPSSHNLVRLTQHIATRHPGFTLHAWEVPLANLAADFGVSMVATPRMILSGFDEWLTLTKFREAAETSGAASRSLAGFWRTTRPVPEFPGKFIHDHVIMEAGADGPLRYRVGLFSNRLVGWAMACSDQMYCCATNQLSGASIFCIFNRVNRPRVDVMDGITLACMADAGGVPVAATCLIERIGDLSGDAEADNARYEELLAEHPIAPDGSVPPEISAHLWRDIGPTALANGGDANLMMRSMSSLARGGIGPFAP